VEFDSDPTEFFTSFLQRIAPETAKVLEETTREIEMEAKKNWPVNQSTKNEDRVLALREQRDRLRAQGYSDNRARVAARDMLERGTLDMSLAQTERREQPESKRPHSADMFRRTLVIQRNGTVVASVVNDAPYAWAIKMGMDSRTASGSPIILPLGVRISNELIWKPAKKKTKPVANVIADEITKLIDKG
tara:strand:+ start:13906 stop:14475 length:570 start_codon:yes stop_codon:yes gene_type:complete